MPVYRLDTPKQQRQWPTTLLRMALFLPPLWLTLNGLRSIRDAIDDWGVFLGASHLGTFAGLIIALPAIATGLWSAKAIYFRTLVPSTSGYRAGSLRVSTCWYRRGDFSRAQRYRRIERPHSIAAGSTVTAIVSASLLSGFLIILWLSQRYFLSSQSCRGTGRNS